MVLYINKLLRYLAHVIRLTIQILGTRHSEKEARLVIR